MPAGLSKGLGASVLGATAGWPPLADMGASGLSGPCKVDGAVAVDVGTAAAGSRAILLDVFGIGDGPEGTEFMIFGASRGE